MLDAPSMGGWRALAARNERAERRPRLAGNQPYTPRGLRIATTERSVESLRQVVSHDDWLVARKELRAVLDAVDSQQAVRDHQRDGVPDRGARALAELTMPDAARDPPSCEGCAQ